MKYAITPDKIIHQVVDEKVFYSNNPDAQDITNLPNTHEQFERQKQNNTPTAIECFEGLQRLGLLTQEGLDELSRLREEEKKENRDYCTKCKKSQRFDSNGVCEGSPYYNKVKEE